MEDYQSYNKIVFEFLLGLEGFSSYKNYYQVITKEKKMKLSAPKVITWWIAVIIGVLGILGHLTTIQFVSANAFWFVAIGFVLLVFATLLKEL